MSMTTPEPTTASAATTTKRRDRGDRRRREEDFAADLDLARVAALEHYSPRETSARLGSFNPAANAGAAVEAPSTSTSSPLVSGCHSQALQIALEEILPASMAQSPQNSSDLHLPIEIWIHIFLLASSTIRQLAECTSASRALRAVAFRPCVKAAILVNQHSPRAVILNIPRHQHLPDIIDIVDCLLRNPSIPRQCAHSYFHRWIDLFEATDAGEDPNLIAHHYTYDCHFWKLTELSRYSPDKDEDTKRHSDNVPNLRLIRTMLDAGLDPARHDNGKVDFLGYTFSGESYLRDLLFRLISENNPILQYFLNSTILEKYGPRAILSALEATLLSHDDDHTDLVLPTLIKFNDVDSNEVRDILARAVDDGRDRHIDHLLAAGVKPTSLMLARALHNMNFKMFDKLLSTMVASSTRPDITVLTSAIEARDIDIVERILALNVPVTPEVLITVLSPGHLRLTISDSRRLFDMLLPRAQHITNDVLIAALDLGQIDIINRLVRAMDSAPPTAAIQHLQNSCPTSLRSRLLRRWLSLVLTAADATLAPEVVNHIIANDDIATLEHVLGHPRFDPRRSLTETALVEAITARAMNKIRMVYAAVVAAEIPFSHDTVFEAAVRTGRENPCKFLADRGVVAGVGAVMLAVERRDAKCLRVALESGGGVAVSRDVLLRSVVARCADSRVLRVIEEHLGKDGGKARP